MKFYVRSYENIKKINYSPYIFTPRMKKFCGKGPFEFEEVEEFRGWFRVIGDNDACIGFVWHISWLGLYLKDKQYLLEFKQ